jgi:hypothetical protein
LAILQSNTGANPTIAIGNASAVKINNALSSLVRFEKKSYKKAFLILARPSVKLQVFTMLALYPVIV